MKRSSIIPAQNIVQINSESLFRELNAGVHELRAAVIQNTTP
jgi:hypothetical protein